MCGIFGVITKKEKDLKPERLKSITNRLFKLSESRGKEASGIAVFNGEKLDIYKQPIPASKLVKTIGYKKLFSESPFLVLGHTRLVTNGAMKKNDNNQPILKNGFVCIHNGIIVNDAALWKQFPALKREYEIDTEIIPALLNLFSLQKTFSFLEGTASIAILFNDKKHLALATNSGSLYFSKINSGGILVFASEKYILEKLPAKSVIFHIEAGSGYIVNLDNLEMEKIRLKKKEKPLPSSRTTNPCPGPQKNVSWPSTLKRCCQCVLPETMPFIEFDENGICNYCRNYKKIELKGKEALEEKIAPFRNKSGEPDCLLPFSGGRDSSYGLHYVKNVLKMNPVAYSYDWGMVTDLARRNQARICGRLGIEHILVSADIKKKRDNIRKNITAWLKKPDLGMIPLFMAGDKQYFYHTNRLKKQIGVKLIIYSENLLERTDFKSGFCGLGPDLSKKTITHLSFLKKLRLAFYYLKQFSLNPSYLNTSLVDSLVAFFSYYGIPHDYLFLYHYIRWDEKEINSTLINEYEWETAKDTKSTWRIGDGTASLYNYIYYTLTGFTENDTFRSNQIREGLLTREEALKLVQEENMPRYESIKWYCDVIGIDFEKTLKAINSAPKLY